MIDDEDCFVAHHQVAGVIVAMSKHSRPCRKVLAQGLEIRLYRVRRLWIEPQMEIAIKIVREEEAQFPSELRLIECQMRADGIGLQSRFCGILDLNDEL